MIEHAPWRGAEYGFGVEGQKVAIVGWSTHEDDIAADTDDAVVRTINQVSQNKWPIAWGRRGIPNFYTSVRNYFGFGDHRVFWPKVAYFCFLPSCVPDDDKYSDGTREQLRRGKERFLKRLSPLSPDKVFIFTSRWKDGVFPPPPLPGCQDLGVGDFRWATYNVDNPVKAIFLRHPQGAPGALMRAAVQRGLKL